MIDNVALHNILCSSTHISHIIMCWNSVEWVVSVVSHLQLEKYCRKTCSDRPTIVATQALVLPQCSQVEFGEFRGRDTEWLFSPLFSSFDWSALCDWLSDNKHCRRCRQEGIYRLCQMPARCRVARAGGTRMLYASANPPSHQFSGGSTIWKHNASDHCCCWRGGNKNLLTREWMKLRKPQFISSQFMPLAHLMLTSLQVKV